MLRAVVQRKLPKTDVHVGLSTIDRNRSFAAGAPQVRYAGKFAISYSAEFSDRAQGSALRRADCYSAFSWFEHDPEQVKKRRSSFFFISSA